MNSTMYHTQLSDCILDIKNLNKTYENFSLKDVSFSLPKGYIMGFIGPNGAGKTTTIKSILQLVTPDSGSIQLFDQSMDSHAITLKDEIGIVMDVPFFPEDWKVKDVAHALSPFYASWDSAQYQQYITKFHLDLNKKVMDLSRGMKVKLMLSLALSHHAHLLILDEPTSGLDPVARDELMEILLEYISDGEHSVLFSTHITSDLEKIADFITFIRNGQIEFTGEKDVLMEKFARIKGDKSDINFDQKKYIIGFHEHKYGFDGLILNENLNYLPKSVSIEPITLDELIVYMNKEGINHD